MIRLAFAFVLLFSSWAEAETVNAKYRGAVDLKDLRGLPLSMRKTNLQRLLERRPEGIFVSDFEQGEIWPELFRKACEFGSEGIVSERSDKPYRGGRSPYWINKNRTHPAKSRDF